MSEGRSTAEAIYIPLALVLLPVLYVVSIGPVIAFVEWKGLPYEPFETFYMPVIWLYEHTPLKTPLTWWAKLWGWY